MPKRIAVLDADTALYAEASRAEVRAGERWLPLLTAEQCYKHVEERLAEMIEAVEADGAIVALTSPTNFRKAILPTYKLNRSAVHKPTLLPELRALVQSKQRWPVLVVADLEADDVCGISAGRLAKQGRDAIIVSSDKDLRSIPGLLWNPSKTKSGNKREIESITEAEADRFHIYQTIVGDPVDNYKGLPGSGPVKALTLLNEASDELPAERWQRVLAAFALKGYTPEYALTQARVARILRWSDWNSKTKKPILWDPPELVQ